MFYKCSTPVVYPIPRIDHIHAYLRGCTVFSTLDMSEANHQLLVDINSQKYLTTKSHLGLYAYTRDPNGIHSGLVIFQEIMNKRLRGISHVITYFDDIFVAGTDKKDHDKNLHEVFSRLRDSGFHLNKSKCTFNQSSVTYLAHKDHNGNKLVLSAFCVILGFICSICSTLNHCFVYCSIKSNQNTIKNSFNEVIWLSLQ